MIIGSNQNPYPTSLEESSQRKNFTIAVSKQLSLVPHIQGTTLPFRPFESLQLDADCSFPTVRSTAAVSVFRNSGLDEKAYISNLQIYLLGMKVDITIMCLPYQQSRIIPQYSLFYTQIYTYLSTGYNVWHFWFVDQRYE